MAVISRKDNNMLFGPTVEIRSALEIPTCMWK